MAKVRLRYLGGHPGLQGPKDVTVERLGQTLKIQAGMFGGSVAIPLSDIRGLTMGKGTRRSVGKAAAGAIIGGVLTGGIGAIAGAAIGGRSRDDSTITLTVAHGEIEVDLLFTGDRVAKQYGSFAALLNG